MSAAPVVLCPAQSARRVRWRNGAGWTREILSWPPSGAAGDGADAATAWDWRLSIADIESDGPFSSFPGIERECLLLRGEGVRLQIEPAEAHTLSPPSGRLRFDGGYAASATLVNGRVEVLNLMWRRDRIQASTWHRPLVGTMVVFVDPGSRWLVHVLAGHAHLGDGDTRTFLAAGDTACLGAADARARHALEGGGELFLVRLEPAA